VVQWCSSITSFFWKCKQWTSSVCNIWSQYINNYWIKPIRPRFRFHIQTVPEVKRPTELVMASFSIGLAVTNVAVYLSNRIHFFHTKYNLYLNLSLNSAQFQLITHQRFLKKIHVLAFRIEIRIITDKSF
jgi:hypothetical protein